MNRRKWISIITACFLLAGTVMWIRTQRLPSDGGNVQPQDTVTLSVWVFSRGWDTLLAEFQKQYPQINIDVRTFRSAEQLYNELLPSISANVAPQLAEIGSFYGIAPLAATGSIIPVGDQQPGAAQLSAAFEESFRYEGKLWALPVGGSIPLLYYREELLSRAELPPNGFCSWNDVEKAAALPVKEGLASPGDRWRLAIDNELPWYAQNIGGGMASEHAFDLWERWVHTVGIVEPLSHRMAVSDFINGKVGVLLSSSSKLPVIERYIGGKFQFGIMRLPESDSVGIVPAVNGLVQIHSVPAKETAAQRLIGFMMDNTAQSLVWTHMGYIPAKTDVVMQLAELSAASGRQWTILDSIRSLSGRKPAADDYDQWMRVTEKLELLEQQSK